VAVKQRLPVFAPPDDKKVRVREMGFWRHVLV